MRERELEMGDAGLEVVVETGDRRGQIGAVGLSEVVVQ
jgi:hypothetical protein